MGRASQVGKVHQGLLSVAAWLDKLAQRFIWAAKGLIAVSFGVIVYYGADRAAPFAVLSVEPAEAYPGDTVTITASVWRDKTRSCSAEMSRYIFDSTENRFDIGTSWFTQAFISEMDRRTPGRLSVSVHVPENAAPGPARLESVLFYRCNRVHNLWPVEVTTSLPFTVLSPR